MDFNVSKTDLLNITTRVRLSNQDVSQRLGSISGKFSLWWARCWGGIPQWAANHVQATRKLERAIYELKSHQPAQVPKESIETLQQSRCYVTQLAARVRTAELIRSITPQLPYVKGQPALYHLEPANTSKGIEACRSECHLNLGLLLAVYERTSNKKLKEQISFLALNYLFKAAPIAPQDLALSPEIINRQLSQLQLGLWNPGLSYNRESDVFNAHFEKEINAAVASACGKRFVLLDSLDIDDVLSTQFALFKIDALDKLSHWLVQFDQAPESLGEAMPAPPLIDCTAMLEPYIYTGNDPEKNLRFKRKVNELEVLLNELIEKAAQGKSERLKVWLKLNMICICKCKVKKISFLKTIPLFLAEQFLECPLSPEEAHLKKQSYFKEIILERPYSLFCHFLSHTGSRLGSVAGRKILSTLAPLKKLVINCFGTLTQYAVKGKNILYFRQPRELTQRSLFLRLRKTFESDKSYLHTLGAPTLQLIEGVLAEISQKQWIAANQDLDKRELIQTCLYRLFVHLGNSEKHQADFAKFAHEMELIHYELMTLVTLFDVLRNADFHQLYLKRLGSTIPDPLKPYVSSGLTKSSMNTFAGIQTAVGTGRAAYTQGIHFEFKEMLGANRSFEALQKAGKLDTVDLYLSEFNHNISLYLDPVYTHAPVIAEIEALLKNRPANGNPLTVALDTTIDTVNSDKVEALLNHFSREIEEGRLIVAVFQSGQKFWLNGMDNVYGSPVYIVNNEAKTKRSFDFLFNRDAYKTDPLSKQWFCLLNKYVPHSDNYQRTIFKNAKAVLSHVPHALQPEQKGVIRVSTVADDSETFFVDLKCYGPFSSSLAYELQERLFKRFADRSATIYSRGGYGYYHPNLVKFMKGFDESQSYTTLRISLGINPDDNALLIEFLHEAAVLSGHVARTDH